MLVLAQLPAIMMVQTNLRPLSKMMLSSDPILSLLLLLPLVKAQRLERVLPFQMTFNPAHCVLAGLNKNKLKIGRAQPRTNNLEPLLCVE